MKIIIFIFAFLFCLPVFSNISGKLHFTKNKLVMGDVLSGVLLVHPVTEQQRLDFYTLTNKLIGKGIQILTLNKIEPNNNNVDVLEVHGTFVIINQADLKSAQPLIVKNNLVSVQVMPSIILKTEVKDQKMIIVAQDYISLPFTVLEKVIIFILSFIILYFGIAYYFQRKRKLKKVMTDKEIFMSWNNIFQSAKTRQDYEEIYKGRNVWIEVINIQTPPIVEFNRVMHTHQYKKDWSIVELQDVEYSFDNIRGIFK